MPRSYSTYEAKAKLSEILRQVRAGKTIRVSHRGVEVAEIRPVPQETGVEARLDSLESRGALVRSETPRPKLQPVASRPGALERFLAERDA